MILHWSIIDLNVFDSFITTKKPKFKSESIFTRLISLLGIENFFALNSGHPIEEGQSNLTEYAEIRKQLVKNKTRVKRLANLLEAQNTVLRRMARKLDTESDLDDDGASIMVGQKAVAQSFFYDPGDEQLPFEAFMKRSYKTYV